MKILTLKSYAKINIALSIVGKKSNGYHILNMINDEISIYDVMTFQKTDKEIIVTCDIAINMEDNIVYKVCKYMFEKFNIENGININIQKNIPTGAGLGGGSSNCATAIKAINQIYELNLSNSQMANIGEMFGADVPYFIYGGAAIVRGIGEEIETFYYEPFFKLLVIRPSASCNTKYIFQNYKYESTDFHIDDLKECLKNKEFDNISQNIINSLENVAINLYNEIRLTKKTLAALGFPVIFMTGSGSCVVALYEDGFDIQNAVNILNEKPFIEKVFLAEIIRNKK